MKDKREKLISGNIFSLMMELTLPAIVGMLVISLYSFVDAIFVGKFVGEIALGAISIGYAFTLINNGIAVLVGIGSASVLSRAIGGKDQKTIDVIMGNVFILTLLFSVVTTVLGFIFAPQLLHLGGATGEMHGLGVVYLRIVFLASFFVNFGQASNMLMRGEGKMTLAMVFMGISAILNIILDAFFIVYLEMGIEGAAIATVISQIELGLSQFIYFKFFSNNVKIKKFKLEKSIVKESLSVGVSAMFMQVFALVQQVVLYATLKKYGGENQVVLMGAFFRYMMLSFIPLWGISQGFQPFAGTNFGAQCFDRVKKGTYLFTAFAFSISLIFWVIFMLMPDKVLGLFIDNPALIDLGKTNSLLAFALFPLSALMIINLTLLQALGKAKAAGILVVARQLVLYVPAVLLLPLFFGVRGAWLAGPIVDVLITILSIIFVSKVFMRDLKGRGEQQV
ncbi:MAG: MATE family efflux transporter [Candidatus Moraniibacteriota bacterium]|nr:MAG: MATE family efflux transporter [Candidatus Moranbacteria bacterium]